MFKLTVDSEISLCLLEERHAEAAFALVDANRAYLRQWMPWLDMTTSADDIKHFIQRSLKQFAGNQGFQLAIMFQGQLSGMIGFHELDWTNRASSVGYWLAADFQGQGIMTRACRFLINYAFVDFGLNRVEIRCAVDNHKSRAIPERLGFKNEGTIRQAEWLYDHYVDLVIYGMLADQWDNNR